VYGILTAAAALAYAGIVALLDALVRSQVSLESAVVASVIIPIGFNPARSGSSTCSTGPCTGIAATRYARCPWSESG
jgi:hypothetical protein